MAGQIIDISTDNKYLYIDRGFLCISEDQKELARIAIDNIEAVIANAHGITYSNNLLFRLAEEKIPFVVCGANHCPIAFLLPLDAHYKQGAVMDAQIRASLPLNKNIWKDIIKSKLTMQSGVLNALNKKELRLENLIKQVKSGDVDNCEAQGAKLYWATLFGSGFRRDREQSGINAFLNYGYTVLRSSVVRSIVAAGLHPTLGIHHSNMLNSFRLADDLMEPFRPFVDIITYDLCNKGVTELSLTSKKALVSLLSHSIPSKIGMMEISITIQKLSISLAKIYLGEKNKLDLPMPLSSKDWISFKNDN